LCDVDSLQSEDLLSLRQKDMLHHFAFAFIPLNFTILPDYAEISEAKLHEFLDWEIEMSTRLASSLFTHAIVLPLSGNDSLLLFVWGIEKETWESGADKFREKLIKISKQITQLGIDVLVSEFYPAIDADTTKQIAQDPARALKQMQKEYSLGGKGSYSDVVEKALQYILSNVEKRIMLQDVADFVCVSPGYLSTLFKREYHQNLMDFVNQAKIDQACELLNENKYRINEIAYMLGFENAYYFARIFRRYVGVAPSAYRGNNSMI
jgi:AraC-like DNA-binding protein